MLQWRCGKIISLVKNLHFGQRLLLADPVRNFKISSSTLIRFQHRSVEEQDCDAESYETKEVIEKVNKEIRKKSYGRLFAVVQLCGKQFKVTDEDLIVVDGFWAPNIGDKIRLEKVLLVGSTNFTLVGRPLLPKDQVSIYATIIEKTWSPTIMWFKMIPKKRFKRTKLMRIEHTFIRINSIDLHLGVNEIGDVDGLRDRIF